MSLSEHPAGARSATFLEVIRFVWSYWRRRPARLTVLFVLMTLGTLCDVLLPVIAGRLVDVLSAGPDAPGAQGAALWTLIGFLVIALGFYLLRNLSIRLWSPFASQNMSDIVTDSFAHVQKFSADWHANHFAGSTVRKISRAMWAYDTLSDAIYVGLYPPLLAIVGLSLVMALEWPIVGGFMLLVSIAFAVASVALSLRYVAPANVISNKADSNIGAALADAMTCNAVVKSFGAEDREEQIFRGVAEDWRVKVTRTWNRYVNMWLTQSMLLLFMQAGLIGITVWQWSEGRATPGDVAFVISSFFVISGYLRWLGDQLQMLQKGVNELDDVVMFAKTEQQVKDRPGSAPFKIAEGRIEFEAVTFSYEKAGAPLYEDFSLTIEPGERVALVGPSGSGKSTFVKLVQRLYDVDAGRVLIDGQNIAHVRQADLRRAISLVPQDPALFHRSLAENLAYAKPEASREEIEYAARRANAHDFIMAMPDGYDTMVGERGVKLSGGERQRVAIARAFIADAPILILDEATSSLDSRTEADIHAAMAELIAGRTAILIAHRLSTVRDADRILVFDQGRIVEEGRHDELLARTNGRYRELSLLQGAA